MHMSLQSSVESSCPLLAMRWDREQRGTYPSDDNACYLWEECGVPPDVVQYCAGTLPWHGERFVPVPVETQWSICLTSHYGSCRWLRERRWYTRETALVCPLLGSRADRQHKYLYSCTLNVCHARGLSVENEPGKHKALRFLDIRRALTSRRVGSGAPISAERQHAICLTNRYAQCERYVDNLPGP
ncbi:MAG: hypothetical protein HYY30_06775 [Chloroflexi bacterium]|nr:hypothetical protein [Chloroflexota bacterium]